MRRSIKHLLASSQAAVREHLRRFSSPSPNDISHHSDGTNDKVRPRILETPMNTEARTATIAWCISPILLVILCVVSLWLGSLSISASFITSLFVATYAVITFRFFRALYRSDEVRNRPWVRLSLILAVTAPVAYFTLRQFAPIRIVQSQSSPSAFDELWDSADQIAYGFPSPFLRFFDVADQLHGKTIVDWTSLLMIIWIMLLFVFLALASSGLSLKFTKKNGRYQFASSNGT